VAKAREVQDEARLHYRQGTSDKVYDVFLRQRGTKWVVETEYGRRNGSLSRGKQYGPSSWMDARIEFDEIVASKKAKGYQEIGEISQDLMKAAEELSQKRQALSWLLEGQNP
jgi:hypothetical protein